MLEVLKSTDEYNKFSKPVLKQMELFAAKCELVIYKKDRSVYLGKFYNYIQKYKDIFHPDIVKQTKGVSLFLLIVALQDAIKEGFVRNDSKISLDAAGTIDGKDMFGLVQYYNSIGLNLIAPFDKTKLVHPMSGVVGNVLTRSLGKVNMPPFIQEVHAMMDGL